VAGVEALFPWAPVDLSTVSLTDAPASAGSEAALSPSRATARTNATSKRTFIT
jgi:hypothetical protein